MKNHIANIVTGSRIVFSLPLVFLPLSSTWFYVFYLICGFTDMIDGTIARKTGTVSNSGANLDTVADFVFMFVCSIKILPLLHIRQWQWVWIIVIALIKIIHIVFIFIRKEKQLSVHSTLNKITGFALFLLPLFLPFVETAYSVTTICVLATVAALQEGYCIAKRHQISKN